MDSKDLAAQKMMFIDKALDEGWCVRKKNDAYIFRKPHYGEKEVFLDSYLKKFLLKFLKK